VIAAGNPHAEQAWRPPALDETCSAPAHGRRWPPPVNVPSTRDPAQARRRPVHEITPKAKIDNLAYAVVAPLPVAESLATSTLHDA
jgi:hypothetical protein